MTDENLFEERCSCGASIKVMLPTSIGGEDERKSLLQRYDDWRARHVPCLSAGIEFTVRSLLANQLE